MHLVRRPVLVIVTILALGLGALGAAPAASAASAGEDAVNAYATKLGARLGAPTSEFGTVAKYGRTVTFRSYANGFLAHNGSSVKLVSGQMLADYNSAGGVRGTLGAPVIAQWCNKSRSACLQRFQKGSIYRSSSAPRQLSISRHSGEKSEIIAVARSQQGYVEPAFRRNKYGKWVNGGRYSDNAWCSFFVSWVSGASGNGGAIPKRNSFPAFKRAVKAQKKTSKKPSVGSVALIDFFGNGRVSHAGIVVEVRKNSVVTLEGNIDARGTSGNPRGVHKVVRAKSRVLGYATPKL